MNIEQLREYCITKKGTTEEFPFDQDTLVFKVMGKIFAMISLEDWESDNARINLKCDPKETIRLREKYSDTVLPGYHMNKKHWNTVIINSSLPDSKIQSLIDHSYDLVVSKLPKKIREELQKLS